MRTFRLAILGDSPCMECTANCCRQNGHDFAVLLEGDERRKLTAFSEPHQFDDGSGPTVERVLPYRDGRCVFLDVDHRCTIYDDRPVNCRRFECVVGFHHRGSDRSSHSRFLQLNPDVLDRLEQL